MTDPRIPARPNASLADETGEIHGALVEGVRDYAIFALDPNGFILSWNEGARRFKGYEASEAIGKHFSIFYPPEKIAAHFPEYELETAGRVGYFEDEGWRVRKDGTQFWANVVITAIRNSAGMLIGFTKITRDLTERRRAEEALRESEHRFRLLVQGVKDYAIFMVDPSGRVATWNEGAERIKGYSAEEIIGQHISVFYPPGGARERVDRELAVAIATGTFEEEGIRVRKDGSTFWASVVITALHDEQGVLVGFAKVTRDLTERHRAEERALEDARRIASEETARLHAEERVRALHESSARLREQAHELEERRAEAETANRVKSSFLAAMSHELRTPLNAIGGYAELLHLGITGPVTPQQADQLGRIRRAQQHLMRVINDILNFSSIEAGRLNYDIGDVPLNEATDGVTQMIAPQAGKKRIVLDYVACEAEVVARADRAKVQQIMLNLLSNALKFTAEGGTVSIRCSTSGEMACASIRDSGIGIPPEQLQVIFEPFVQVGRTLTSDHEGTGLGLSISRDLARAMDGDITVESEVGAGSTFTLRLPLAGNGAPIT